MSLIPAALVMGIAPSNETDLVSVDKVVVDPVSPHGGDPVTATVWISNLGETLVDYEVPIFVDQHVEASVKGQLPPGGSQIRSTEISRRDVGTYEIWAGDQRATFSIDPAEFQVESLAISPDLLGPGGSVTVEGLVRNIGGVPGTQEVELRVDGRVVASASKFLAPGSSAPLLFEVVVAESGTKVISLQEKSLSLIVQPTLTTIPFPDKFLLSSQGTVANTAHGRKLPLTGEYIELRYGTGGELIAEFPFTLIRGERLGDFHDLATGAKFLHGVLTLPIRTSEQTEGINLVGVMEPPIGPGQPVISVVNNLELRIDELPVDFSLSDRDLGYTTLTIYAELSSVPLGSQGSLTVAREISQTFRDRLNATTAIGKKQVGEVAFVVSLIDVATGDLININDGKFRVSMSPNWMARYGSDMSIRVGIPDGELGQVLSPSNIDFTPDGKAMFDVKLQRAEARFALFSLSSGNLNQEGIQLELEARSKGSVPGEVVQLSGEISNDTDARVIFPVTLSLQGAVYETKNIVVESRTTESLSFFVKLNEAKDYFFDLEGEPVIVKVAPPLDPLDVEVSNLIVVPSQVLGERPVWISMQVTNHSKDRGLTRALIRFNGVVTKSLPVVLIAGESKTVGVTVTPSYPGNYIIDVDDLSVSMKVVSEPDPVRFSVDQIEIDRHIIEPGIPFNVRIMVTNHGDSAGMFEDSIDRGSEVHQIGPMLIPAKTQLIMEAPVSISTPGNHTLELLGNSVEVQVKQAATAVFQITELKIIPNEVKGNGSVRISAVVSNPLDTVAMGELVLKIDGMIREEQWMPLGSYATKEVEFVLDAGARGVHVVDLNGKPDSYVVVRFMPIWLIGVLIVGGGLLTTGIGYAAWLNRKGRLRSYLDWLRGSD